MYEVYDYDRKRKEQPLLFCGSIATLLDACTFAIQVLKARRQKKISVLIYSDALLPSQEPIAWLDDVDADISAKSLMSMAMAEQVRLMDSEDQTEREKMRPEPEA